MEARVEMIKAGFKKRYGDRAFLKEKSTEKLVEILAEENNIKNILFLCLAGEQPLNAVVDQIEDFAEANGIVVNGKIPDDWKRNVGKLIGTITHFIGYDRDNLETLQRTPKYFNNASTFNQL